MEEETNVTRNEILATRVTQREKDVIRNAAKRHGMGITNFILSDPRIGETKRGAFVVIDRPEVVAPGLRLGDWSKVQE